MANKGPGSYEAAIVEAGRLLREGQLNDPGSHFPYKIDVVRAVREENPPAGRDGPDDDRLRVSDYISVPIIEASEAYVAAQEEYLRNPGDATAEDYHHATEILVEARRRHRAYRPGGSKFDGVTGNVGIGYRGAE